MTYYIGRTTTKAEVRRAIRLREYRISAYDWVSGPYRYCLEYMVSSPTQGCDEILHYRHIEGWWITAGCRRWSGPLSMRRHYRDTDWHRGEHRKLKERLRDERLGITNRIARFARKHGIKFAVDKARKGDLRD